MITESLIIRFFEGKCNAEEAAIVEAWLKDNPDKLKEYIGVEEWEGFQPARGLSPDVSGRLWNNINKDTRSIPAHHLYLKWLVAAASAILVIGLSWQFVSIGRRANVKVASTAVAPKNIFNHTPQKMALTLSDGSTVELSPNSSLSYPEAFSSSKRDVVLNGEAEFDIARDEARPFSVYSNSVLISVLGTRFTVNSYAADSATKVVLHEGKVMVKVSGSSPRENRNEYFLAPGDIFISRISKKINKGSRILHLEKDKDDCYVFDNYPLDVVFDQLQIIYGTKIVYDNAELGNRTFIGKIDKKDSFDHILQSIVLLNNFHLHKRGDSCIISN